MVNSISTLRSLGARVADVAPQVVDVHLPVRRVVRDRPLDSGGGLLGCLRLAAETSPALGDSATYTPRFARSSRTAVN